MGNMLDWVNQLPPGQRKKPNRETQKQLFELINAEARERKLSADAIGALMKFGPKMVAPFYTEVYAAFPEDVRRDWDQILFNWARRSENQKAMGPRIAPITLAKLDIIGDASELKEELLWLSKNDGDHARARDIGGKGESARLRKLLSIQLSDPRRERKLLDALDAIFDASPDNALRERYAEFRNALAGASESEPAIPASPEPVSVAETHEPEPVPVAETIEPEPAASKPARGGRGPLELLCALEKLQVEQMCAHEKQIRDMLGAMARQQAQFESLAARLTELEAALPEMSARRRALEARLAENRAQIEGLEAQLTERRALVEELEAQVASGDARIRELEEQNQKTSKDMGDFQQMFDNSSNQKLDEFKQKLAADLRGIMKDFADDYSDFSDAERAALYSELLRDLIDRLNRRGIDIEVN